MADAFRDYQALLAERRTEARLAEQRAAQQEANTRNANRTGN